MVRDTPISRCCAAYNERMMNDVPRAQSGIDAMVRYVHHDNESTA